MPEIQLTPEMLNEEAAKLLNAKAELESAFNKIQTLISGLVGSWRGQAQEAFTNSFEGKKPTFNQLAQDMERFADFMKTYATSMGDSERGGAQRAAQL